MSTLRILSGEELRRVLPMSAAIDAMRTAFTALHENRAIIPQRIHLDVPEPKGVGLFMPAYMGKSLGIKTVTLFDENPSKGLPYIQGLYCLFDGENGTPTAIMDGKTLTAIRTGAASGLATELLARQDAESVAILGAGVQGRTQLEAVGAVRTLGSAAIYDPLPENAERFAEEMSEELGIPVRAAASAGEAIRGADIVCAATVSSTPVFEDADLSPGAHLNAIGSYKPHVQEIPSDTVLRAKVVVDERDAALQETGDLIIPIEQGLMTVDHIYAELGELTSGVKKGRTDDQEITFFKSVGLAIQDLAAATVALEKAATRNIGTLVSV